MNVSEKTIPDEGIILTGEYLEKFKRAMKIGYYKDMLKKGIISLTEFDILMLMQNQKPERNPL